MRCLLCSLDRPTLHHLRSFVLRSLVPSPTQRTLASARPPLTPTQASSFTPSFLQSAITHRNGSVAFCICFLSSSLTERVCPPPSCLRCPRTVPGTTYHRSSSVFVSKWMCLKSSCVSLVERRVRLALGAQLFLWPPVLCSVIQSWQLVDRGRCLPGDPGSQKQPAHFPHLCSPKGRRMQGLPGNPAGRAPGGWG